MFDFRCCVYKCAFKMAKLVKETAEGPWEVDVDGLTETFLLSVNSRPIWKPVVEQATKKCFDQFNGSGDEYLCGG